MSQSEFMQYTSSFDVRKGKLTRLLPEGAVIIDAYANNYLGVTVNFMARRLRDAERRRLPSPDEAEAGTKIEGYKRHYFRLCQIGTELPPNLVWSIPIKICDPQYGSSEAYYLFYAIEP